MFQKIKTHRLKICFLVIMMSSLSYTAQENKNMAIPTIDNSSKLFNANRLAQVNTRAKISVDDNKLFTTVKDNLVEVKNTNGKIIISYSKNNDEKSGFSGYDYSESSDIGVFREFFPNGNLKTKGLFCYYGFKIGEWYNYNEDGILISVDDYDKGFDFDYNEIINFCIKNNISLEKKNMEIKHQYESLYLRRKIFLFGE